MHPKNNCYRTTDIVGHKTQKPPPYCLEQKVNYYFKNLERYMQYLSDYIVTFYLQTLTQLLTAILFLPGHVYTQTTIFISLRLDR